MPLMRGGLFKGFVMQITIQPVEASGRIFRPIKRFGDYTLAQEVIEVREPFKDACNVLSDKYCVLHNGSVIADANTTTFKNLEAALLAFKGA